MSMFKLNKWYMDATDDDGRAFKGDGVWELHEPDAERRITLASVGCELLLEDVYADVEMPERVAVRSLLIQMSSEKKDPGQAGVT